MLPKYVWLLTFLSALYMLYSSTYSDQLLNRLKSYYAETIKIFFETEELMIINDGEILFTQSALKKYSNLKDGLYLSILGQVFDVTSGAKHYGPGENYHAFTGCDASAAFTTGDFTDKGMTDEISGLTNKQIQSLMNWVEFYRKTYKYKGKLIGRYYTQDGSPTNERFMLEERLQIAIKSDSDEEKMKIKFPPCNIEWDADIGSTVWCTKNSGGIARNWIGNPRMLYDNPESKQYRCACVQLGSKEFEENKGIIREYKECSEEATTCILGNISK